MSESSKAKSEPRVGDVVGDQYRLKSILGRGGMGVVFLAQHITIGREYALKTLLGERVEDIDRLRFQSEGRAIARLEHHNIVKVYDLGLDKSGCLYYVMDRLDGISLAETVNNRKLLDINLVIDIFIQICDGLGYAHKLGLVHRDVKPSNIYLLAGVGTANILEKPLVKIIDYGLVKQVGVDSVSMQSRTAANQVCGSPLYMSPEQGAGGKIDERSDIYSLGCSLYECLTGEPPFKGQNGLETAFMHQKHVLPTLHEARPDRQFADNLENLVAGMLEKSPHNRYQNMDQVAADLKRVKKGKPVERLGQPRAPQARATAKVVEEEENDVDDGQAVGVNKSLILGGAAMLVVTACGLWLFSASLFSNSNNISQNIPAHAPGDPAYQGDSEKVRQIFAACPPISSGVSDHDGKEVKVFEFPSEPVGVLVWGPDDHFKETARGRVEVDAHQLITLVLPHPEGDYTRRFPQILSKIGKNDIQAIEISEPFGHTNDTFVTSDLNSELIEAITPWTGLKKLTLFHTSLPPKTIAAMADLPALTELRLRDASFDGAALAKIKWLSNLRVLDLKGCKNVDPILFAISGSTALQEINLDLTSPSDEALAALCRCPNLENFSLEDTELTSKRVAILTQMQAVGHLNLKCATVHPDVMRAFSRMQHLKVLNLANADLKVEDLAVLRGLMPNCRVLFKPFRGLQMPKAASHAQLICLSILVILLADVNRPGPGVNLGYVND